MLTSKCFMPKRLYCISMLQKNLSLYLHSNMSFLYRTFIFITAHIHGSYILSTHGFQSGENRIFRYHFKGWRGLFCCCPLPMNESLHFPHHIKSFSSNSKAAAISSASELLPSSSSLDSLEDSLAESASLSSMSSSASSSSSLASSCFRLWPLQ